MGSCDDEPIGEGDGGVYLRRLWNLFAWSLTSARSQFFIQNRIKNTQIDIGCKYFHRPMTTQQSQPYKGPDIGIFPSGLHASRYNGSPNWMLKRLLWSICRKQYSLSKIHITSITFDLIGSIHCLWYVVQNILRCRCKKLLKSIVHFFNVLVVFQANWSCIEEV